MRIKSLSFLIALTFLFWGFSHSLHAAIPVGIYYRASTSSKRIALTFDDGPHPGYTDRILGILEEEGVRATFFMIGSNVEYYPEVAKRVAATGHEIGNHSYSHPYVKEITNELLTEEIRRTDEVLERLGIARPTLFRPPQGVCPANFMGVLRETGKSAVLWNIDTRDWAHTSAKEIVEGVLVSLRGGDIILFHDSVSGESTTIPAIKKLIPLLKEKGYQFVTVSQLLAPPV